MDYADRDDVTVVEAPAASIGFITGFRGDTLRRVEAASGTFIFTDSGKPGEAKTDTEMVGSERIGGKGS